MEFSLIVCTYMRPDPLLKLLNSVKIQSVYPTEILVIDGSANNETQIILEQNQFKNLKYFKVKEEERGLTKQRNYGINLVNETSDIVCFLDDDTELYNDYFEVILKTFENKPDCIGVGGVAVNQNRWFKIDDKTDLNPKAHYVLDGYAVKESSRNILRNKFGLQSPLLPSIMPNFSHVRTYSYPLNNKVYPVDLLIGMSFSFRKTVFNHINFSTYFEGYGLYEDADFSLRALKFGQNVINTDAKLNHYHHASGRPNKFKYGKMVIRNGWYVWRVKYPKPTLKARFKWNATAFLLTAIRITNIFASQKRKEALTESLGRVVGWWSLIFNKPRVEL